MGIGFSRVRQDIWGVFWLGAGIFLALSLFSYTPTDPSLNSTGNSLIIMNYCGYFGSFLSDLLLQSLGLTAWLFVLGSFRKALLSFMQKNKGFIWIQVPWLVLLFLTTATLFELHFPEWVFYQNQISIGGFVGKISYELLVGLFNVYGVVVILWCFAIILIVFYTDKSIREFADVSWGVVERGNKMSGLIYNQIKKGVLIFKKGASTFFSRKAVDRIIQEKKIKDSDQGRLQTQMKFVLSSGDVESESLSTKRRFLSLKIEKPEREIKSIKQSKIKKQIENWQMPPLSLLQDAPPSRIKINEREMKLKAKLLVEKFSQFQVKGEVVAIKPGPAVTLFEFKPEADVPVSKITKLENDLSMALSSESVRIIAPIPGRDVVGIETANAMREMVYLKDMIKVQDFWEDPLTLSIPLGRQANGEPQIVDLRKMPHLLVAGSTGSGKSVFTVSTLASMLFKHSPKTLRLLLIDPKQVDLAMFDGIPHLCAPIINEPKKAVNALRWAVNEMEKRYRSLKKFSVRKLEEYNEAVEKISDQQRKEHILINEELINEGQKTRTYYHEPLPYIVVVVEEFGDLMSVERQNVEMQIVRLAQKARAAGIHLFLAMQSPRKDVVTGLIKTNIPGRVSFKVASKTDSRIILDDSGAERLLAQGDMLFLAPGVAKAKRHHGAWLHDDEVLLLAEFWKKQGNPQYEESLNALLEIEEGGELFDAMDDGEDDFDERYDEILASVSEMKEVSASLLQRKFRLGYPRAARMIEVFEKEGVVGPPHGSKPRQVLINR